MYLPHRVIPMLPRLLCEKLCSLTPDEDKLAFTVIFHIDSEGRLEEKSIVFTKSLIRSRAKYSYE